MLFQMVTKQATEALSEVSSFLAGNKQRRKGTCQVFEVTSMETKSLSVALYFPETLSNPNTAPYSRRYPYPPS